VNAHQRSIRRAAETREASELLTETQRLLLGGLLTRADVTRLAEKLRRVAS